MRQKRKIRFFSLLIAVILAVSLLIGCGNAGGTAQGGATEQGAATQPGATEQEATIQSEATEQEAATQPGATEQEAATQPGATDREAVTQSGAAPEQESAIDENGSYTTKEDVALYIHTYGKIPSNFITKKEAEKLGWHGGSLEPYAPGKCIGGSYFGNYEGLLPDGNYKECDIDTLGRKSRGAKRIIYSDDGRIYYTDDHYESFTQIY